MNPFAVKLTEYIHEDGRTVARIVRETDGALVLSTMHAYKSGGRVPRTIAAVDTIAKALKLSATKRDILARCYRRALELTTDARVSGGAK